MRREMGSGTGVHSPQATPAANDESIRQRRHVTVDRATWHRLSHEAACWRRLNASPHVAELIFEWAEWDRRRAFRQASSAVSAGKDWRAFATVPTFAELERRRTTYPSPPLSALEIKRRAAVSWGRVEARIRGGGGVAA